MERMLVIQNILNNKYLSCICGDGRGIFWASVFLLNPLSMVFISVVSANKIIKNKTYKNYLLDLK